MGRLSNAFRALIETPSREFRAERKHSAAGGVMGREGAVFLTPGAPNWSERGYAAFAAEGYRKNVAAFRSVRLIAEGAASAPWTLTDGGRRIADHPILSLIEKPNPLQGGNELFEAFYGYLLISGNAYLEAVAGLNGAPAELYALRPDRMKVIPGAKGWPVAYVYSAGGCSHRFPVDIERGIAPILHVRTFNPLDDHYGLSPIEAAAYGVDIHNAASGWNKALLDNAARPSGALVFDPGDGAALSAAQFERLKADLTEHYQGALNAGRPLLLEGGLKWQQIGFSPADMEFIETKREAARDVALAFGVPPMLLGIPGDNTYSNYQEANRALWRSTILPLLDKTCDALNGWLTAKFPGELKLSYDAGAIPALAAERDAAFARAAAANFLTVNEKRRALGLDPIAGGDGMPDASIPNDG